MNDTDHDHEPSVLDAEEPDDDDLLFIVRLDAPRREPARFRERNTSVRPWARQTAS